MKKLIREYGRVLIIAVVIAIIIVLLGGFTKITYKNGEADIEGSGVSKIVGTSIVDTLNKHNEILGLTHKDTGNTSTLLPGVVINEFIPANTEKIIFTDLGVPNNKDYYNLSLDEKTVGWTTNNIFYISNKEGQYIDFPVDASYMFANKYKLTSVEFGDNVNTSNTASIKDLFLNCKQLKTITGIENFDTSKINSFESAFEECQSLTNLDVSKWNFSNATTLQRIFRNCFALTSLDVSNWNTSNVTNMDSVFGGCRSLKYIDVSKWNTSKVTTMADLFCGCRALKSIDVTNFDTRNVEDMSWMFCDMTSIKEIDISNFETPRLKRMYKMFHNDGALTTIYASSKWDNSDALDESDAGDDAYRTFSNCKALQGTISYISSKQGPSMANYKNGYFIEKKATIPSIFPNLFSSFSKK